MELSYTTRFSHLWRYNALHIVRSWAVHALYAALAGYFAISTTIRVGCEGAHCVGKPAFIFAGLYVTLLGAHVILSVLILLVQRNRTALTDHRLELRSDGLFEQTPYNESLHKWASVLRTVSGLGIVAVYIAPSMAFIIPWSAFPSRQARVAFIAAVKERASAA